MSGARSSSTSACKAWAASRRAPSIPRPAKTLGSISDMQITGWHKNGDGSYGGTLNTLPDRGYNARRDLLELRRSHQPVRHHLHALHRPGSDRGAEPGGDDLRRFDALHLRSRCEPGHAARLHHGPARQLRRAALRHHGAGGQRRLDPGRWHGDQPAHARFRGAHPRFAARPERDRLGGRRIRPLHLSLQQRQGTGRRGHPAPPRSFRTRVAGGDISFSDGNVDGPPRQSRHGRPSRKARTARGSSA